MNEPEETGEAVPESSRAGKSRVPSSTIRRFWKLVEEAETIALTCHIDPDGDALGSMIALYHVLCHMGKDPVMLCRDSAPEHLRFLPGSDLVFPKKAEEILEEPTQYDLLVILDCSEAMRLGPCQVLLQKSQSVVVADHHSDKLTFTAHALVDDSASATGEILHQVFREGGVEVPAEASLALYVAIMTDTGSFRYGNTSARSFRIASELVATGAIDVRSIGIHIFARETLSRLQLRGLVFRQARVEDGIIHSLITLEMIQEAGSNMTEAEGIVDDLALCKDAEIAIMFIEARQEVVRVQIRSIKNRDILPIATSFGGGGHHKAAGGRIRETTMEKARRKVLEAARVQIFSPSKAAN